MTWKSHIAIGSALALPFNPICVPLCALGSTAPDWLEFVLKAVGYPVAHRTKTHYLIIPIVIILFAWLVYDFKGMILWFGIGYLSHWLADSLTVSGVPISPLDKSNFTLLGGRLRTGEPLEFIIAFGFLATSLFLAKPTLDSIMNRQDERGFNVFYMDWRELYEERVIDAKEYLEHRFKFF